MRKLLFILLGLPLLSFAAPTVIKVGTTGDYPPLTQKTTTGYSGQDVCIISRFAKKFNYSLQFESTSWSKLSTDLNAGKFTIAVGGISGTPARSAQFGFSEAIESSAKVAMIRCSEQQHFTKFADIDNESITVIENRGGTNELFALQHLTRATIKLVPENSTAIAALTTVPPQADVMFTDNVEVAYRHELGGKLCRANLVEIFPQPDKVFLFSRDSVGVKLQQQFNSWWFKNSSQTINQCKLQAYDN